MAANSEITVTSLDFANIKESMKTYIASKPEFTDYNFEGSMISMLLDLLAYNTYQNAFYSNMVGNEMFLDSAQLRNNVVSRAKALGYTPRSSRGASVNMDVVVTPSGSPETVTIAKDTEWEATIDGETFKFVTPQAYVLTSANSYSQTISIKEGRPLTHKWTVDSTSSQKYVIPNSNVDTTSLTVQVQESSSNTSSEMYTLASDISEVLANTAAYFLQEVDDDEFEVYFGDGIIGKQPDNGNIVIIDYRVCNGSLGNDVSSFTDPSTVGGSSTFTVSVTGSTSGGANNETIESIKFNAPNIFETQNRAVLAADYSRIIIRDNGDIQSVSAWGGEENNPPIYGKVYVSVKPTSGNLITSDRKDAIKNTLKRHNVMSIDVEFVDASFMYIIPDIRSMYNPNLTTLSAEAIQDKVLNRVVSYETNNLGTFDSEKRKFRFSKFLTFVDSADDSITNSSVDLKMEKRFQPTLGISTTYRISFGNEINKLDYLPAGHERHGLGNSITSSSFTYGGNSCFFGDTGDGVIQIYYIDSSTGNRVYVNREAGTVNYSTGLITIEAINITAYSGSHISIYTVPENNNIRSVRNQILLFGAATVTVVDENTSATAAITQEATTQGVSTNVIDPNDALVVY